MKKCPKCAEEIKDEAKKCKHCGADFTEDKHKQVAGGCCFIVFILVFLIIIHTVSSSTPEDNGIDLSRCEPVPGETIVKIQEGLTLDGYGFIRNAQAVRSEERGQGVWYISGILQWPDLEDSDNIATFAVSELSDADGKPIAVDAVAREFSDWPEDLSADDEGAVVSEACTKESAADHDTAAIVLSRDIIRNALKSPSTADFPSFDVEVKKIGENVYSVESYVDSQNSFGAQVRTPYRVVLEYLGGEDWKAENWELRLFILDGETIIDITDEDGTVDAE